MKKIYAQMYSVRDYMQKDFFRSLEQIAEIGYAGVEFAGYYGYSAEDLKEKIDALGLEALSSHVSIDLLTTQLDKEIAYLKVLGGKYIVCPYAEVHTVEDALELRSTLKGIGEVCAEAGLELLYHNHAHELVSIEGVYPLDVLFEEEGSTLAQEPDVFWVAHAGVDPIAYIEKHVARCPIIHLKQIESMTSKKNVEAGKGMIDFKKIMTMAPDSYFIYEQETYDEDSMRSMAVSLKTIQGY